MKKLALNLHLHSKHGPPTLTIFAWGGPDSGGQGRDSLSKAPTGTTTDFCLASRAGIKLDSL